MSYAGDVTARQAQEAITTDPAAVIVDCRTRGEWEHIGIPDLDGAAHRLVLAEWQQAPDGRLNPAFLDELAAAGVDPGCPVYFLCRSGQRSRFAAIAATTAGYSRAYNVADGFEGPPDTAGRRGTVAGWQAAGLPWRRP